MSLIVDILEYGTGSHTTSSEAGNALATDLLTDGVVGTIGNTSGVAPATGGFAVNAQGTPDNTILVTAGIAYVTGTPASQGSQRLRVKLTSNLPVTITANTSGAVRYDWIYIKLDPTNMANPNTAADNVATLFTSRSTSSSVDNGPGVSFGYPIALVTVANGFVTITNGNIADKRIKTGALATAANLTNPSKFSAYMSSSAYSTAVNTWTRVPVNTKNYDAGSNLDIATNVGRFTASVSGTHRFDGHLHTLVYGATGRLLVALYKNGIEAAFGSDTTISSGYTGAQVGDELQLAVGDTVEFMYFSSISQGIDNSVAGRVRFSGYLVSTS